MLINIWILKYVHVENIYLLYSLACGDEILYTTVILIDNKKISLVFHCYFIGNELLLVVISISY